MSMSNMMSSICSLLVIFSVISNVHCSVVKRTTCSASTALDTTLIQAVLDAHNNVRSQAGDAADMLKLLWSDRVASVAQHWANQCTVLPHNECDPNGEMAQNFIFFSDWSALSTDDISLVMGYWDDGKSHYNSTTGTCPFDNFNNCRVYKRMVWASTSEIGCGMNVCPHRGALPDGVTAIPDRTVFVCYYNPGGNIADSAYQKGTPCSKCPGSYRCENNLCVAQ